MSELGQKPKFNEGLAAFGDGVSIMSNPYNQLHEWGMNWEDGWFQGNNFCEAVEDIAHSLAKEHKV